MALKFKSRVNLLNIDVNDNENLKMGIQSKIFKKQETSFQMKLLSFSMSAKRVLTFKNALQITNKARITVMFGGNLTGHQKLKDWLSKEIKTNIF